MHEIYPIHHAGFNAIHPESHSSTINRKGKRHSYPVPLKKAAPCNEESIQRKSYPAWLSSASKESSCKEKKNKNKKNCTLEAAADAKKNREIQSKSPTTT